MKTTKYYIFLVLFLLSSLSMVAQKKFSKEQFKQERAEFLKKELNLTPKEAAQFIPLSEELMDKKFQLFKDSKDKARAIRNKNNLSASEYERVIDAWNNNRVKEALLVKEYYEKFKKVLPMYKLRKYQEVDTKFMRTVMDGRKPSPQAKKK